MAKFTPGAIISEIRGTIASTTFSKNASGAIIRNRVTPINRNTTAQSNQRQIFANISSSWRGLTQAQRDSWIEATPDFPYQDSLGQTKFLTGAQLFQKLNLNIIQLGGTMIEEAPAQTSFPDFAVGTVAGTTTTLTAAFTPDPIPAGFSAFFYATRPLSAGKQFVSKSDFKLVQIEDAAAISPADLFTSYESKVASLGDASGKKVFVEMRLVETASGIASTASRGVVIIA